MRDDYKLSGPTGKLSADIEKEIYDAITAMSEHTKLSVSELTNTALKRFVIAHSDFMPPTQKQPGQTQRKAS